MRQIFTENGKCVVLHIRLLSEVNVLMSVLCITLSDLRILDCPHIVKIKELDDLKNGPGTTVRKMFRECKQYQNPTNIHRSL